MRTGPLVPPIKCQGIKTKLIEALKPIAESQKYDRWIEPFCGSCVVALNVQPRRALLSDTNHHIIRLYREIQSGELTPGIVRSYLVAEGNKLAQGGESHFYEVRSRFNEDPNSLDFLFLNRSCFNGLIRFNRKGRFNTPYGHKPERFAQAYVTKITNQVAGIAKVLSAAQDWRFEVADFRETLKQAQTGDLVYADPPYSGRHTDYFNAWSEEDESDLANTLAVGRSRFILSTWHSNEFRSNSSIERWSGTQFCLTTREHFYHVGASEELRHPMIEAIVTNFPAKSSRIPILNGEQALLFA